MSKVYFIALKDIHAIGKRMKCFAAACSFIIASCVLTACGIQNAESETPSDDAAGAVTELSSVSEQYLCEATPTVALTVKMEADMYFVENKSDNKILHDCFQEDGGFGSDILSRHPVLEGLEYVIELNLPVRGIGTVRRRSGKSSAVCTRTFSATRPYSS